MIEIRAAEQKDLESILALQKTCYLSEAEIYNDYQIQPLMQDLSSLEQEWRSSVMLKGLADGKIIASVRGFVQNDTGFIGKLIVHPNFQNKGIGRQMMREIENMIPGCRRFELFTGMNSRKNLRLYHLLGYREFRREPVNHRLTLVYLEKFLLA